MERTASPCLVEAKKIREKNNEHHTRMWDL